ncbi:unnamed protein product [Caenorhabditis nigoni]
MLIFTVQFQIWSPEFARELLYKELIKFEQYQDREKRAFVNEKLFSEIFETSIERFSLNSKEPPVGCASLAIMQVPVRLLKVIKAEDATKRDFVDFAPRFPTLKRKLDSTVPSGDFVGAPLSKKARIESSINDPSKNPSIQRCVEQEAVMNTPRIQGSSEESEDCSSVTIDEDNDDEGMEIRKYPGSLNSKAIGSDEKRVDSISNERTTVSRVEAATMEAPAQESEEVVLQNDGQDPVESVASSKAPTRSENQGNWHRAGFIATSQSKSVGDGWSNEDKRGYRKLFPESKLERDLAISINEMKTTDFSTHAALLEKLYLKIWCFIRLTMQSIPISYCLSETPSVPQSLPADIGSWRVRHFKDFVKQIINRLLLPQVATDFIQNKYFDNALEELFTVVRIKSVEVLINIDRSAI